MKKLKIVIVTSIIISFILMFLGFIFLMIGAVKTNYDLVYIGIAGILIATFFYSVLIIYGIVYYFKRR